MGGAEYFYTLTSPTNGWTSRSMGWGSTFTHHPPPLMDGPIEIGGTEYFYTSTSTTNGLTSKCMWGETLLYINLPTNE